MEKQIKPAASIRFTKEAGPAMTNKPGHPTTEQIYQYAEGSLSHDSELAIEAHFAVCSRCVDELELAYDFVAAVAEAEGQPIEIPAVTPGLILRLANLLSDRNPLTQIVAAQSLGHIGTAAATPEVLARLKVLCSSDDKEVRQAARNALNAMRSLLERLGEWLTTSLTRFLAELPSILEPAMSGKPRPQSAKGLRTNPQSAAHSEVKDSYRFAGNALVFTSARSDVSELIGKSVSIVIVSKANPDTTWWAGIVKFSGFPGNLTAFTFTVPLDTQAIPADLVIKEII